MFFENAILVFTTVLLLIEAIILFAALEEIWKLKKSNWYYVLLCINTALMVLSYLIIRSQEHNVPFFV